jgi:hypothetical protein
LPAVRRALAEKMGNEKLAEAMHHLDANQRTKMKDLAFAHQMPEQQKTSKSGLEKAFSERELKEKDANLHTNWKTYSVDEQKSIIKAMNAERRAAFVNAAPNMKAMEAEMVTALGGDVREIDKTREEIAKLNIKLPADKLIKNLTNLSQETKDKIFDIIKPETLSNVLKGFNISGGISGGRISTLTDEQVAFLNEMQRAGKQNKVLGISPSIAKHYRAADIEAGTITEDQAVGDSVKILAPSEVKNMSLDALKETRVAQNLNTSQLGALASETRVTHDIRQKIKSDLQLIHGIGTPMRNYLNTAPAWKDL